MGNKLFLDVNILLDFTLQRDGELLHIERIIQLAEDDKVQLFISESVLFTTLYFLQKNKLPALTILRELSLILNFITFKKETLFYSLEQYKDLEDGVLYFSAANAGMDYFISRNVKDFAFTIPTLPVITPRKFLKEIFSDDLS